MKITTAPLSEEDIKILKSGNTKRYFLVSFLVLLASVLFYCVYFGETSLVQIYKQDWDVTLVMIFAVLFVGLLLGVTLFHAVYAIIKTQKDVTSGQKEILTGILTKKDNYDFYIDDEKMAISSVNASMDNSGRYDENIGEIGQTIAIERSIYTKTILKKEVLNEQENAKQENQINIINTEKIQKTTMPFSQEDIKILKQETTKSYILTSVFTIIFFLALYYAHKGLFIQNKGFVDFEVVFPTFASLIMGAIVITLLYKNAQVQKDLKSGQKEVLMGILTDKKERYDKDSRGNATKAHYYFCLGDEEIQLNNAAAILAYNNAKIGQKIVLQRSIKSQTILKIDILNALENTEK